MKKVVRTVWIGALSGLAFLTACCSAKGLSKAERKQLVQERNEVMMELDRTRNYEVEGSLDEFMGHKDDIYALENRLDAINSRLGDSIDLDRNIRRRQILRRIDSLDYLIKNYIPPCIYGSPEMMEQGGARVYTELDRMEDELKTARKELEDLDRSETDGPEIMELLYGGPDIKIEPIEERVILKDTIQDENPE